MKTTATFRSMMLCCIFTSCVFTAYSQSQSKKPNDASYSALGCLACPGSEWNDYDYIKSKDGKFATTAMSESGFCFQTVCYYSRGLLASDFNFSIPNTATITGIKVKVGRKADAENAVYDLAIQLQKGGSPVGNNKKSNAPWPVSSAVKGYGNASDTWGLSLTPADVNNSAFGFWLQSQNVTSDPSRIGSVDFIRMIVFYTDGFRSYQQTATATALRSPMVLYPNPTAQSITFSFDVKEFGCFPDSQEKLLIQLRDTYGYVVWEQSETVAPGIITKTIDLANLPAGTYLLHCMAGDKSWNEVVVKE